MTHNVPVTSLLELCADLPQEHVVAGDEPDDHNEAWTSRQVAQRRDHDIAALVTEWEGTAAPLVEWMRLHGPRPLGDVIIHEQDLRGALGVPGLVLGWSPAFRTQVRKQARNNLDDFLEKSEAPTSA